LEPRLRLAALALLGLLQRHPRRVMLTLAAILVGGTGAAMAVASFAPDPAQLPVRQILETIQAQPLSTASEGQDIASFTLYRSEQTRSSDTAQSLLKRLGVDDEQAASFIARDTVARLVLVGRAGRTVSAEIDGNQKLQKLITRWSPDDSESFRRLTIVRKSKGLEAKVADVNLVMGTRLSSGIIRTSLFAATDEIGLPDAVANQLVDIFSGDIDFHHALRRGDRFSVAYETLETEGEVLRTGRVLSAEFINNGRSYQAVWFRDPGQANHRGDYYSPSGQSLRRSFLSAPLAFSRVTSGFKMRFHPILNKWAAHHGVDYGAAMGTPVRTVGDGVVDFAGSQNGFGNVVMVRHRNGVSTVYAHLSKVAVRKGQSLTQGQNIGAVGASGWATGPHLHFEYRVNGQYRDPLTIARHAESTPVSANARGAFQGAVEQARMQLDAAAQITQASAD
jgi:murein DD-endopeptidase MepM/ murein hydrolase activator NlpD